MNVIRFHEVRKQPVFEIKFLNRICIQGINNSWRFKQILNLGENLTFAKLLLGANEYYMTSRVANNLTLHTKNQIVPSGFFFGNFCNF